MNHKSKADALAYGLISAALCTSITIGGCGWITSGAEDPTFPVPTEPAPVLAICAEEPAINSADLWSADRDRMDAPLLGVGLDAETQWDIFEQCGQDTELFCAVMAIAAVESDFTTDLFGDGGDSIGIMQINTRWHTGRIEALGMTDLTDPVQCVAVAIDYLQELESRYGFEPESEALLMAYNMGPSRARKVLNEGRTSTDYSREVMTVYQGYLEELEEGEGIVN